MTPHRQLDPISQIAAELLNSDGAGAGVIEIEEQDGKIVLKGQVDSEYSSAQAEWIASRQDGVDGVINHLSTDYGYE